MLKRFGMFAAMSVLAVMVLAACGSGDEEAEPTVTRMPAENAPEVTPTAAEEEETTATEPADAASSPAAASPVAGSPVASPVASETSPAGTEQGTPAASPVASPVVETPTAEAQAAAFEVDMKDIFFDPKELTIPANTDVVITLPNTGVTTHNFHIDALGVNSGDVAAGGETTVTINAAPGEYEYYCAIPGHKQAGMVGKLIVQ